MKKILLFKRNSRLCYIIILQLVLLPAYSFQQQQPITGTVSDAQGTLPGVSIYIKGTTNGTFSDQNGFYSIKADRGEVLVFSYLGYKTVEVTVADSTVIDVLLEQDATLIDEIVINAGYYSVKDRERTGSIARVTAKDIENQPVNNPLEALQGRMTGVDIVQTSGVAGSGFEVKIRGQNSIMAGNNPLYIIDGVPYDGNSMSDKNISEQIMPMGNISPLNMINPASIESIEVLKDADATAIYGAKGANGVILITTKKGSEGKTNYTFNYSSGIASISSRVTLLNSQQYIEMREEAFENDGISSYPFYAYDVNGIWNRNNYTDWQKELIGGTAYTHTLSGIVSGGNKQTSFLISGMYHKESTVFPGDFNYNRTNINSNIRHHSLDNRFSIILNAGYGKSKNFQPMKDLTLEALTLPPVSPLLYDEYGELNWENSTWSNPLAALASTFQNETANLLSNAVISYRLFSDLEAKVNLGYNLSDLEESYISPHTIYDPGYGLDSSVSHIFSGRGKSTNWIIEPQLSWVKDFDDHRVNILLGTTFQQNNFDNITLLGAGFSNNYFIHNLSAANNIFVTSENKTVYSYHSLFGRFNYAYKQKLFLNLTSRRDGSSRFGPGNKYGYFGAIGGAWLFSEDLNLSWLNIGKLRGSYGVTGNDQIGDYQYLNSYSITDNLYDGSIGLVPSRLYNPNFKWEKNRKSEIALEISTHNNKISTSLGYYHNRSSNQLINYALPGTTGFSSIQRNLDAIVDNTGWEWTLNGNLYQSDDFKWTAIFNITVPKNKLVEFPGLSESTYSNRYVIGKPLNIVKLYQFEGLDSETGLFTFKDFNNDGIISEEDKEYIADLSPKYYGGFSNEIQYKNWELNLFFQFTKKDNFNFYSYGLLPGEMYNQPVEVMDRWQEVGDNTGFPRFSSGNDFDSYVSYSNYSRSSGSISDASFIRFKSASLSYTIPFNKGQFCKLSIQGQNLLTWTRYKHGDPDQGVGYLPSLRRINFGVHLQL